MKGVKIICTILSRNRLKKKEKKEKQLKASEKCLIQGSIWSSTWSKIFHLGNKTMAKGALLHSLFLK